MPSQPEAQGDILKEFREGTFLSSLDMRQRVGLRTERAWSNISTEWVLSDSTTIEP